MIAVCTRHPDCAVTHDDARVCPVCVAIDDATDRADNATNQLDQARVLMAPLVALLFPSVVGFTPTESPRPTGGEVKVTITRDPEPTPTPGPDIEDVIVARVTTEPTSRPQAEELICVLADAHGIRAVKNAYRQHVGESANRSWSAADLAFAWADRLFPIEPTASAAPTAPDTWVSAPVEQPDPDENVTEEPETTERDTWTRDRIAELKADPNLQAWNGLAKIREAQTGTAPLAHLSAPDLRQAIAEYEYDHLADDIPF